MFDGNIGTWHSKPYDIKLKQHSEPYHGKKFPITRIHELTFKQELDIIEGLKVINKVNRSQWGAPTFPKQNKYSTVRLSLTLDNLTNVYYVNYIPYLRSNISC